MNASADGSGDTRFTAQALEVTISVGLVLVLAAWIFRIVQPFIVPLAWGVILAVALHPAYSRLRRALGGRPGFAAAGITVLALLILVIPALMLTTTLVDSVRTLSHHLHGGTLSLPVPDEAVASWPLVGEPLYETWSLASVNLEAALRGFQPQLVAIGTWLLSAGVGAGIALLQFVVSILLAGFLLAYSEAGGNLSRRVAVRLMGERGPGFAALVQQTVRSVARGILGVALIQALLAGIGFLAVGLPGAGLWALLCLIAAVVQLPVALILLPVVIYVFSSSSLVSAVLFAIWCAFVGLIDNVLKPLLMGRGARVPVALIFVGAIGGFVTSGIIGLFVGAAVLAIGYELFRAWLEAGALPDSRPPMSEAAAPAAEVD